MAQKTNVSRVLFVISALSFLLPFVTVSCNGQKLATLSGTQLAVGTTVQQPQMFGPPLTRNVGAEPLATLAGICALAGLGLGFTGSRSAIFQAIAGAAGALFLLLLRSSLDGEIAKQTQGLFHLEYESGYILALLFFLSAAAWNFYAYSQSKKMPTATAAVAGASPTQAQSPPATTSAMIVCPQCGRSLNAGSRFCDSCGKAQG